MMAAVRAPEASIDLLLVDLRLPPAKGPALVRKLRTHIPDAPILVFSGTVTSVDEVRELASLGVAGYVNEYSAVQHILPTLAPQLFPDEYNRRSSPRVVLGMPINYRVGNKIAAALTLTLSQGGLAIRTTNPLELGTPARLRFKLPGAKRETELTATVTWIDSRVGMGMKFDRVDEADQALINEFVEAHFFRSRKV